MDRRISELLAELDANEKYDTEHTLRKSKCQIKEATSLLSNRRFEEKQNEILMGQIWSRMHWSKKYLIDAHKIDADHQENYSKAQLALLDIEARTKVMEYKKPELTKDNIFTYF